jgi:hypothetical protein
VGGSVGSADGETLEWLGVRKAEGRGGDWGAAVRVDHVGADVDGAARLVAVVGPVWLIEAWFGVGGAGVGAGVGAGESECSLGKGVAVGRGMAPVTRWSVMPEMLAEPGTKPVSGE